MATKPRAHLFRFKVALKSAKRISRGIEILGNQTLDDLHEAIFEAFDRDDEHLYSFYFLPPGSRGRNRLRDAAEYTHPYVLEEEEPFHERVGNAAKTTISSLKLKTGQRFDYLFDFGDQWWHELTVEEVDGEPENEQYPRIIDKRGKSPPQYPDLDDDDLE